MTIPRSAFPTVAFARQETASEPEGQVRQADQVRGQPQRHGDPREMPRQRTMHQPVQPRVDGGAEVRVEPPLGVLSRVRVRGAHAPPAANDAGAASGERPAQGVARGTARGHLRLDRGQERSHRRGPRAPRADWPRSRPRAGPPAARGAPRAAGPPWRGAETMGSSRASPLCPRRATSYGRGRGPKRPMARSTSVPRYTAGTATDGQPAWIALISARNATGSPATSRRPASASSGDAR